MDDGLLIMGCSKAKRSEVNPLPALYRYDGPSFKLVRRYLGQVSSENSRRLKILVVSAEYGLIPSDQEIPNYNRQMNGRRASELRPQVARQLEHALVSTTYSRILIHAGKHYLNALGIHHRLGLKSELAVTLGPPGTKLATLRDWLYGDIRPTPSQRSALSRQPVSFKGQPIDLSTDEVVGVARKLTATREPDSTVYKRWHISVDGNKIGAKWLVSALTGIKPAEFHTDEARRLLTKLGLEVLHG